MSWSFKKSRGGQSFADAVGDGLCDIHCHLFPGFDDGARNMDETLAMVDGMARLGYASITATAHFDPRTRMPDLNTQKTLIAEIVQKRGRSEPTVLTGAEIFIDEMFTVNEERGVLPRIGNARSYLVEFGFQVGGVPPGMAEQVSELGKRGMTLVLAHPERFPDILRNPAALDPLRRAGMLLQVDLLSLVGHHGKESAKLARTLVKKGVADFVASDLHRPRDLGRLEKALEELFLMDPSEFVRLASTNPRHLLQGRPEQVVRHA